MDLKHSNPCLDYKWDSPCCPTLRKLGFHWQPLIWDVIRCNITFLFQQKDMLQMQCNGAQRIHLYSYKEPLKLFVSCISLWVCVHVLLGWYFLMKNNLTTIFGSHSKSSKAHFALVISHSAAENILMFIHHILKFVISRAQLVKMGVKQKSLT